ncbi:MAG: hypothetical protein WBL95_07520 [Microcoleus sp.]
MQVKDMTVEQLRDLIRHTVEQCLEEYLGDPDAGLEVKEEVKLKLLESMKRKQAGENSLEPGEVYQKIGMKAIAL